MMNLIGVSYICFMTDTEELKELIDAKFPSMYEPQLRQELAEMGKFKTILPNTNLIDIGQYIKSIPLVISGRLKIFREDEDGNELFLYYLYPGDVCAISLVCTINDKISQVKAVTTEDTEIIMIPIDKMDYLMMNFRSWYQFVVRTYGARLQELLKTIDSIAFHKMDERLVEYLDKTIEALGTNVIHYTHQEIASEMNTSREVVSRLLKQLEKRGLVILSRNKIEVVKG